MLTKRISVVSVSSVLYVFSAVVAARPQYGGVLRVEMPATLRTLDPAASPADASDAAARARLLPLVFETLVAVGSDGIVPRLAVSWEHDPRSIRWRFRLRTGVRLHDGSMLEAPQAAAALHTEPNWRVTSDGDLVIIESDRPAPDLLWELATARHAVAIHRSAGEAVGSGPFRVDRIEAQRLLLRAHEDYWAGRPFVDSVDIAMGRSPADSIASLEVGRADVAAITAFDAARLMQRGIRIVASRPVDLVALVFEEHRADGAFQRVRAAVATAIDRPSLCAVLLQRWAQPAETLLPDWLSGYATLFARGHDRAAARSLVAALPAAERALSLRVESSAAVDRAIADRIAADGRDVGLTIKVDPADALAPRPDMRLMRIRLEATTPDRALASALDRLGPRTTRLISTDTTLPPGAPLDAVYRLERALLEPHNVVPVVHLPELSATGPQVESWNAPAVLPSAAWDFGSVWIRADKP
jgi:ABC-type transport system substrate-binding protein